MGETQLDATENQTNCISTYTKRCFVTHCNNDSELFPKKIFFPVPRKRFLQECWFRAVRRPLVVSTTRYFCCEDHFDLQKDMENYMYFKLMNKAHNVAARMKPGVVPHIFDYNNKHKVVNSRRRRNKKRICPEAVSDTALISANGMRTSENEIDTEKVEAYEENINLDPALSLFSMDENSRELGIQIIDVHSVSQEQENPVQSEEPFEAAATEQEIDDGSEETLLADESEERHLASEDLLLDSDCDMFDEVATCTEEIMKEQNAHRQHIIASLDGENDMEVLFEDSDGDAFEEEGSCSNEINKEQNVQDGHTVATLDRVNAVVLFEDSDDDTFEEQGNGSNEIETQENVQGGHMGAALDRETEEDLCQDSDDAFEEGPDCPRNVQKEHDGHEQHIEVISDEENTCDGNPKNSADINFRFLNEQELEECIVVENEDTLEDNNIYGFNISISSEQKPTNLNEIELNSKDKNDSSDDCIVIIEDSSTNTDVSSNEMKKITENEEDEITEKNILEEFDIIDDDDGDDDDNGDPCIVPEGPQNYKKIVIRRRNLVYSCPLNCTYLATSRTLMIGHLLNHKKKKKPEKNIVYECPICPFATKYKNNFINHIYFHEEPRYPCQKCSHVAMRPSHLKSHMIAKHGMFLYCDQCPFKTKQPLNLSVHQSIQCSKVTNNWKSKRNSEAEVMKLRCHFDPCPFTAATEETLKTHEWIQHQIGSNNIKIYKCYISYCQFETYREELFEKHAAAHRRYDLQCKLCVYKTMEWKSFKDHIINHT